MNPATSRPSCLTGEYDTLRQLLITSELHQIQVSLGGINVSLFTDSTSLLLVALWSALHDRGMSHSHCVKAADFQKEVHFRVSPFEGLGVAKTDFWVAPPESAFTCQCI